MSIQQATELFQDAAIILLGITIIIQSRRLRQAQELLGEINADVHRFHARESSSSEAAIETEADAT